MIYLTIRIYYINIQQRVQHESTYNWTMEGSGVGVGVILNLRQKWPPSLILNIFFQIHMWINLLNLTIIVAIIYHIRRRNVDMCVCYNENTNENCQILG